MDPITDARDLVAERFPEATWALLTGSVLGPARTPGSDLDVVVLRDAEPGFRESLRFRGWPVELFVHTPDRLAHFLASELAARKPSLHRMIATGLPLIGDPVAAQRKCAKVLADGPAPLSEDERNRLRYGLTDLLDDLRHAVDPGERAVLAAALWTETAQARLLLGGGWVSRGKWLLRELRQHDPAFAERWLTVRENGVDLALEVLDSAGGPLFEGYRA
ncbi:nucleotidyltransferase domain-containing protein [Paractinoplanes lichenicola]|uniref:Nucleotidyltransferase domain-containing protein n=1 Tax=Paractinoplanes lichenicola TaxID=2802976 RepID=A0ABS1VYA9_9ACTN|nr:nucleotidyltransferase domain-containing protein [Actinoplanes lichenicola]MBL7259437.1 nucleotidyltransferase domain-containing protein [Actinoplanes lichenicola]